ncbi:MAG: chorismate lyase [Cyanobacteria bacterium J06648_11]
MTVTPPNSTVDSLKATPAAATPGWYRLDLLWKASTKELKEGLSSNQLSPSWQLLLLSDGSTTRNLQLISGDRISADIISTEPVLLEGENAPDSVAALELPTLRRQVWLTSTKGDRLAYGVTWWNQQQFETTLTDPSQPIGATLSERRIELYREPLSFFLGESAALAEGFGQSGPFWGRHYMLWHQQRPLAAVYEVFSSAVSQYLGSSR